MKWVNAPEVFLECGRGSSVKIAKDCTVDGKPVILENDAIRERIKGNENVSR